jgi:ferrochelatase
VQQVRAFAPEQLVLLPLYPQFSTTTTGSSFAAWDAAVARLGAKTRRIKSYATQTGFIDASVELLKQGLTEASNQPVRVLFSAHGLPEKIIKAGDPYQSEIEQTAGAIMAQLDGVDWSVCYQSRVGPLKWIGPSTEAEIQRAATDKKAIVLYPLSFVSEHSETLVELDIDYKLLAAKAGVPAYIRVPTVGTHPKFIEGLARLVRDAL